TDGYFWIMSCKPMKVATSRSCDKKSASNLIAANHCTSPVVLVSWTPVTWLTPLPEIPVMRVLIGLLLSATLLATLVRHDAPEAQATASGDKKKLRFTVGKETTYITTPVDKDGYIDYVAALNERLKKGITPDTNAAVLLWKAMGPHPEGATMPAELFTWLGIDPPPEKG